MPKLPDVIGGVGRDLVAPTTGAQPKLHLLGTDKFITFDGVDDVLAAAAPTIAWLSTVFLFRVDAASGVAAPLWCGGSGNFTEFGTTGFVNVNMGGGQVSTAAGGISRALWHVGAIVQNGAASIISVDGVKTTVTVGTQAATQLVLSRKVNSASFGAISIAEILTCDAALTAANIDTITAALRANHPLLFP